MADGYTGFYLLDLRTQEPWYGLCGWCQRRTISKISSVDQARKQMGFKWVADCNCALCAECNINYDHFAYPKGRMTEVTGKEVLPMDVQMRSKGFKGKGKGGTKGSKDGIKSGTTHTDGKNGSTSKRAWRTKSGGSSLDSNEPARIEVDALGASSGSDKDSKPGSFYAAAEVVAASALIMKDVMESLRQLAESCKQTTGGITELNEHLKQTSLSIQQLSKIVMESNATTKITLKKVIDIERVLAESSHSSPDDPGAHSSASSGWAKPDGWKSHREAPPGP